MRSYFFLAGMRLVRDAPPRFLSDYLGTTTYFLCRWKADCESKKAQVPVNKHLDF